VLNSNHRTCHPVLLAGGLGARLWPLSRATYPKQLLTLAGNRSLLQLCALRALELAPAVNIVTVTTHSHYRAIQDQLQEISPELSKNLLVEPEAKNTAAAIGVAALHVQKSHPNSTLIVMPADHAIQSTHGLLDVLTGALELAESGFIVTLGIKPTRPETGFGYATIGKKILPGKEVFEVTSFLEKPFLDVAKKLLERSDVYWNSGLFVLTTDTLISEMRKYAATTLAYLETAAANSKYENGITAYRKIDYAPIPSLPIDKIVMEHSKQLALFPIDVGWSDVGSWEQLWEINTKDSNGVATSGDVITEDCRNSLLKSESRLVVGSGLRDIAVIETTDAVLVTKMGETDALKSAFKTLQALNRHEATRPLEEKRPWGFFKILMDSPGFKIKELSINPGARLSLQSHQHRTEHWVVVEGTATVTRGTTVESIETNQSTYIAANQIHRLENSTENVLKVVEIQCGDLLSEDDIERYDDIYDRKPSSDSKMLGKQTS